MSRLKQYFYTIRHLKPIQIYGRVWHKLYTPRPALDPAPSIRRSLGNWTDSVTKKSYMKAPLTFHFLNQTHSIESTRDWNNQSLSRLWKYHLHSFECLNSADAYVQKSWNTALITKWIRENPPVSGIGWDSYPTSLRIVNWIKWKFSGALLSQDAIHSLAVQTRFLVKKLETYLGGNHLLANAIALVFSGAFFKSYEADKWLHQGMTILERELEEQVLSDGGHFELSPMYHCLVLEALLDVYNLLRMFSNIADRWARLIVKWEQIIQRMRVWLKLMIHPDGEIALFNDAALGIAATSSALEEYAKRCGLSEVGTPGDGVVHLKDSGFIRIQNNELTAILDVGRLGPDHLPGHSHADTLSFELSLFGRRIFVDTGISTYDNCPERLYQRSTAAHNTVVVDGNSSSDVWGSFRVGQRARPFDLSIETSGNGVVVICGHNGFERLSRKVIHKRIWRFSEESLKVEDIIKGKFTSSTAYFHLHPDAQLLDSFNDANKKLHLRFRKHVLKWIPRDAIPKIEKGLYHPSFGVSLDNFCLATYATGDSAQKQFNNQFFWRPL